MESAGRTIDAVKVARQAEPPFCVTPGLSRSISGNKLPKRHVVGRMPAMTRRLLLPLLCFTLPAFAADRAQVSVQWEWIRLPHAAANQLIHQHLQTSRDADALRDAVLAMVKRKEAARLDLQALSVEEGQRAKLDSAVQKSYPTEFDPGQVPQTLTVQGPNPAVEVSPVVPNFTCPCRL